MILSTYIGHLRRLAGDSQGRESSNETVLMYLTEESRKVAKMFPSGTKYTEVITGAVVDTDGTDRMMPVDVYVNGAKADKISPADMTRVQDENYVCYPLGATYFWSFVNGVLNIHPELSGQTVVVSGWYRPKVYTDVMINYEMVEESSYSGNLSTALVAEMLEPELLELVRYQVVAKLLEEKRDLQSAVHYISVAGKIKRDLLETFDDRSTVSTGIIEARDI